MRYRIRTPGERRESEVRSNELRIIVLLRTPARLLRSLPGNVDRLVRAIR